MSELQTLMSGVVLGESPRWHDGRLWFSDWGAQEVLAVGPDGTSEVVVRMQAFPFSLDWLPDGRLLISSAGDQAVLRREPDGSLVTHADLSPLSDRPWNELVVDGRGNAYVNNIGFHFGTEEVGSGIVVLVTPDGSARQVAADVAFPNGMVVTPDNTTLILAESYANRLTAFDIEPDGSLSNRRVWAEVDDHPDGICLDADGAVWYADVGTRRCVRVREGGEVLQVIQLDRGAFACMLGGSDKQTLYIVAAQWRGPASAGEGRTGVVLSTRAPAPAAGWPAS
jgi:sugar lactone lactonase YvrE